jgi:hypothetical protein
MLLIGPPRASGSVCEFQNIDHVLCVPPEIAIAPDTDRAARVPVGRITQLPCVTWTEERNGVPQLSYTRTDRRMDVPGSLLDSVFQLSNTP